MAIREWLTTLPLLLSKLQLPMLYLWNHLHTIAIFQLCRCRSGDNDERRFLQDVGSSLENPSFRWKDAPYLVMLGRVCYCFVMVAQKLKTELDFVSYIQILISYYRSY